MPARRTPYFWNDSSSQRVATCRTFFVVLIASFCLFVLGQTFSHSGQNARLTNLELTTNKWVKDSYIILNHNRRGRGYLVNRRDSTIRRDKHKYPSAMYDIHQITSSGPEGHQPTWLLHSKKYGLTLFVPVREIDNFLAPFYYQFAREKDSSLEIKLNWTYLHVNRVFSGLYLRVTLPRDLRKKDGRTGNRRELVLVSESGLSVVDLLLNKDARDFIGQLILGNWPEITPVTHLIAWLGVYFRQSDLPFIYSQHDGARLTFNPLPISIRDVYNKWTGEDMTIFTDERAKELRARMLETSGLTAAVFPSEFKEEMQRERVFYAEAMRIALRAHFYVYQDQQEPVSKQFENQVKDGVPL